MFPLKGACTGHLCVNHMTYFSSALQGLVREKIFHTVEFYAIVIGVEMLSQCAEKPVVEPIFSSSTLQKFLLGG